MSQIPLGLTLDTGASLDTFIADGNELAVAAVRDLRTPGAMLDGPAGSGRSHLLQAFATARPAAYAALAEVGAPAALAGFERQPAVVLDDIDVVLGSLAWERALFAIVERVVAANGVVVVAATRGARHLDFALPDLGSRLAALTAFRLQPLDDEGKLAALGLRIRARGLTADRQALRYLIQRTHRDMPSLTRLVDALDRQSWETGRRLTVPFIRAYLDGVSGESPESPRRTPPSMPQ
ncbi:MAG: DnaA regulatory inactivator Hda [Pseudomonadota bacterium]